MKRIFNPGIYSVPVQLTTAISLILQLTVVKAEQINFNIHSQPLKTAILQFADQANVSVITSNNVDTSIPVKLVAGKMEPDAAIRQMLNGSGLEVGESSKSVYLIRTAQSASEKPATTKQVIKTEPGIDQADDQSSFGLLIEEIMVTAQKRTQNLQDVPISISTLSGDEMTNISVAGDDIRMLAARIPNLNLESTFGRSYPRFYMRGQGNVDFRINATQPIGLYYDEVVLENPSLRGMPLFDLERIEVLRGPQGTLWGKNTTGGAIHLVSKKPTDEYDAYGRVTYGRFNTVNIEAAVGGSIIEDSLAGRASILYQRRDGWVTNTNTGNDLDDYEDYAFRGQLLYTPNENFEALLRLHGRKLNGTSTLFNTNANTSPDKDSIALESDSTNRQDVDTLGVSLNLSYDFGEITLTSITAFERGSLFSRGDLDGSAIAANSQVNFTDLDEVEQITQEVRLTSNNTGPFNWQAGLFYFREDMDYTDTGSNLRDFGNHLSVNFDSESWAIFGQASYDITDALTFTGGLRYTQDDKHLDHVLFYFGPNPADPLNPSNALFTFDLPFLGAPTANVDDDWSELTWDASLAYQFDDNINLYTRITKGFRSGNIDGNAAFAGPVVRTVDPETLISYEGGLKSVLLDGRLRFNSSFFYYDYEDQQIFSFSGIGNAVILQNAEGGTGYGLEIDTTFNVNDNLQLTAAYGYLNSEYQGPTLVTNDFTGQLVDIDGNQFPNAPEHTANFVLDYRYSFKNGEIFLNTDWNYRSSFFFATYEAPLLKGGDYWEGGIRGGYRSPDSKYEIAAWGRNLTDVEELTGYTTFTRVGVYTGPRTFGIDFLAQF